MRKSEWRNNGIKLRKNGREYMNSEKWRKRHSGSKRCRRRELLTRLDMRR